MTAPARILLAAGGGFLFLAVALGAFGAHALKQRLPEDLLAVYQTGVQYHAWHALGLLAVGLTIVAMPGQGLLRVSGVLMAAGIVLFSGSLYALALTGVRWLGAITPLGGLAFLAAWAVYVWAVLRAA